MMAGALGYGWVGVIVVYLSSWGWVVWWWVGALGERTEHRHTNRSL